MLNNLFTLKTLIKTEKKIKPLLKKYNNWFIMLNYTSIYNYSINK